jgi:hypothetical protein
MDGDDELPLQHPLMPLARALGCTRDNDAAGKGAQGAQAGATLARLWHVAVQSATRSGEQKLLTEPVRAVTRVAAALFRQYLVAERIHKRHLAKVGTLEDRLYPPRQTARSESFHACKFHMSSLSP